MSRCQGPRYSQRLRAVLAAISCTFPGCLPATASAQTATGAQDPLFSAIADVRAKGCAGRLGTSARLHPVPALDEATRHMVRGTPGDQAARAAGYRATRLLAINLSGPASAASVAAEVAKRYCKQIADPLLTDFGSHRQGNSWWLVFAAPFSPPADSAAGGVAARVLTLVNEARSRPRSCGGRHFDAAGPLEPNELLDHAAAVHARDMARHGSLDHTGRDGSSAADRATRSGYRWRALGENIASGQTTPDQVVRDWTASPEHCANLMNAEFAEMGVAYAVDKDSPQGIYWAQELGRPR